MRHPQIPFQVEGVAANQLSEGVALAEAGDMGAAITAFNAIEAAGNSITAEAWHMLCLAARDLNPTEAELALESCTKAIQLDPTHGLYYNSRGIINVKLGNDSQASTDFQLFETWLAESGSVR